MCFVGWRRGEGIHSRYTSSVETQFLKCIFHHGGSETRRRHGLETVAWCICAVVNVRGEECVGVGRVCADASAWPDCTTSFDRIAPLSPVRRVRFFCWRGRIIEVNTGVVCRFVNDDNRFTVRAVPQLPERQTNHLTDATLPGCALPGMRSGCR